MHPENKYETATLLAVICSCHQDMNWVIPKQLLCIFLTIDFRIIHWAKQDVSRHCYCLSQTYKGLKSAGSDKRAGQTLHSQISHEVTQLLDIKKQRAAVCLLEGWMWILRSGDVFLALNDNTTVPSF